jgi:CO/xanthine dehydrogenase Mo-binding subunit
MVEEPLENKPWLLRPPEGGYVGRRGLRPKESPEKVTGRAIYTNDIYLPGMLYAKPYRSPYAHARIKKMDSRPAEALPGVWAVIRYDDQDIDFSDCWKPMRGTLWFGWTDSILPDTATCQGMMMGALVIGDSEEICDQALKLIGQGIEWEQLPFILDIEQTIRPGSPIVRPELNSQNNLWKDKIILNMGDVEKGFAASDHVIEFNDIKQEDDVWAGVEPGCMVARWVGEDLEFWFHGQYIAVDLPAIVSPPFKSDPTKPRKLKLHTPYNGGSFGGNTIGICAHLAKMAVIAARKTLRAVKVVDDYAMSWDGISYEVGTAHYKVGFKNDGTIVAIRIDSLQKTGLPLVEKFKDSLKTPNILFHEVQAYWNRSHQECWKDGGANCTFVNLIINRVAAYLNMDPTVVQLLNDGADGHDMAWLTEHVKKPNGMPLTDSLKEVIEAGRKAFDWDHKWHAPGARRLPNGRMHGVAFYAVTSWNSLLTRSAAPGIAVESDGTATIYYRRPDCGQSAPTTYCQVVADECGLRYADVNIEFIDYFHFDSSSPAGSFGTSFNTYGLLVNARKMKKLILEYALKAPPAFPGRLNSPPSTSPFFPGKTIEELDIKESIIFEKANPQNALPVRRITSAFSGNMFLQQGPFFVGEWIPQPPHVEETFPMARQCVFVEVEVDTETGQIEITKLVHPYDVGQSINPDVNDQQMCGGAYQGLGVAGSEAIYYDPRTGVKLNDNLIGYPVLTVLDVGPIESPIIQSHLGWTTYGAFACSEAGKAVTAAALLNTAVYNAIGRWIEETPVTHERVLKALGKA